MDSFFRRTMAIPERTAVAHSSFSVQAVTPAAAPPVDFSKLTYTEPQR